jgi:hypothetical protein
LRALGEVRQRSKSMIPEGGRQFSEIKQQAKAKYRINLKSFRFSVPLVAS